MTLRDFLNVLFKRKWTLLFLFAIFAGGMTAAGMYFPPTYHSVASLYLRSKKETIDQSLVDNPQISRGISLVLPDVLSEVELVKAAEVRRIAIETLKLDQEPIKAVPGAPPLEPAAQRAAWDAYLYENILVEAAANANVINITFTDGKPDRAARIVGGYADAYLLFRRTLATGGTPMSALEAETAAALKRMTEAQDALKAFNEQWKLNDPATQRTELINLLARTRSQVTDERAAFERATVDYKTYAGLLASNSPEMRNIDEVRANGICQSLESQVSSQTLGLAGLLQHNKETTDSVQRVRESLATLNHELEEKVKAIVCGVVFAKKNNAELIHASLAEHENLIKSIEGELDVLVAKVGTADRLAVELDLIRDHYKAVSRRLNQAKFDQVTGGTGNVDVIVANHGFTPNKPFFPPPLILSVIVAIITGLVVSFSCVVVLDILDQSFKTPDEAEKALAVPVLATVPKRWTHKLTSLLEG